MPYWTQRAIKIIQNDLKILELTRNKVFSFLSLLFIERASPSSQNERQPLDSSLAGRIYNIFHDKSFCVRFSPGEADGAETHHHSHHSWIPAHWCTLNHSVPWSWHTEAWQLKSPFLDKHAQRTCAALATSAHWFMPSDFQIHLLNTHRQLCLQLHHSGL